MLADKYVFDNKDDSVVYKEPVVYPDLGIWHPLSMKMFEDVKNTSLGTITAVILPMTSKTPWLPVLA